MREPEIGFQVPALEADRAADFPGNPAEAPGITTKPTAPRSERAGAAVTLGDLPKAQELWIASGHGGNERRFDAADSGTAPPACTHLTAIFSMR